MKRLIINADDLGLSPGVTRGILDAHLYGVVTSTSAMMNSPHISKSLAKTFQAAPNLGMGVHLVLTWGKPVLKPEKVSSLVDEGGNFYAFSRISEQFENFDPNEVRNEWRAQIEAFIAAGRRPDHLDSHHHCSYSDPKLFTLMVDLSQKYGLPIRYPSKPEESSMDLEPLLQILSQHPVLFPQSCITGFYDEGINLDNLSRIISELPEGTSELMCHPGYADTELKKNSTYTLARESELEVLIRPETRKLLEFHQIRLTNFSTFQTRH